MRLNTINTPRYSWIYNVNYTTSLPRFTEPVVPCHSAMVHSTAAETREYLLLLFLPFHLLILILQVKLFYLSPLYSSFHSLFHTEKIQTLRSGPSLPFLEVAPRAPRDGSSAHHGFWGPIPKKHHYISHSIHF